MYTNGFPRCDVLWYLDMHANAIRELRVNVFVCIKASRRPQKRGPYGIRFGHGFKAYPGARQICRQLLCPGHDDHDIAESHAAVTPGLAR
jgi:hypothetical protein